MNAHRDEEWPALPGCVESKHAYVVIGVELPAEAGGGLRYRLLGGRHGQPATYRVELPGCGCVLQSCPKCTGRVRAYKPVPYGRTGEALPNHDIGRAGTCARRLHIRDGYCAGHNGWRPGDVLALAKAALKTWGKPVAKAGAR